MGVVAGIMVGMVGMGGGLLASGCTLGEPRLNFPSPLERGPQGMSFDVTGNGEVDFRLRADDEGRRRVLCYDDDEDGVDDRVYRTEDYENDRVPHLIILLDSVPFDELAERFDSAGWSWFDPPRKVIPPFPTMSGVIFTEMLHAPPLGGAINQYYDRARGASANSIFRRASGGKNSWERRLHYRLHYWENGLAFLRPREWFGIELDRARRALDRSPDRVTIVYFASTSGMLSKHGREGLDEVLDGLERLCLSVLHARSGAVKISVMSDHGHRLIDGERVDVERMLREGGFGLTERLDTPGSAYVELDGLVNYAGIHTREAERAAEALIAHKEIELAMYMDGDRVIVRDARGRAEIDARGTRVRYAPIDADVLDYESVVDELRASGLVDAGGFVESRDWFEATVDHHWPDAPPRLWDAFHGLVVSTPDVMVTTAPGYFVGKASMEWFIDMESTHGGLDQKDSATFVMTMNRRAGHAMRTREVIPTIEPSFDPGHRP